MHYLFFFCCFFVVVVVVVVVVVCFVVFLSLFLATQPEIPLRSGYSAVCEHDFHI